MRQTFKKYIAKFYDRKTNELYSKVIVAMNIKSARLMAYDILAQTSDDAVKVVVGLKRF